MHPRARNAAAEASIGLALALAAWGLYGSTLRLWWTHDDFHHFRVLASNRPFWYFFDGAAFRAFSPKLLTPLLFFSLDLDRRLFGFDAGAFHVHQLLAVSLCPAALYGVLRLWLPRSWSAVAAWIFLVGPTAASLAPLLMVRHYVEAILLATLAVGAWGAALRRRSGGLASLSAALYFAACMAKEIAVPLVVLLPFLPPPSGSDRLGVAARIRLALPHATAFVLYLLLRLAALGTLAGRSGFTVQASSLPALARTLPARAAAEMLGGRLTGAGLVFGAALAAGAAVLLRPRSWRGAALAGVAAALALLPVLPVSTQLQPRYAVPAWIVAVLAFTAGCRALAAEGGSARRGAAVALAVAACLSGVWLNRQDWRRRFPAVERMSVENRFLLDMDAADVLRQPATLAASLRELEWMRQNVYGRPPGGGWFQDDFYLCQHRSASGRFWGYDPVARRVVDVTARIPELRARHCSAIRAAAPLSASFRFAGEDLFWRLGPYRAGTYRFVLGEGVEAFDMPRSAAYRVGRLGTLPLRVEYTAPAGWVTYSPVLQLQLVEGWRLDWSRPAGLATIRSCLEKTGNLRACSSSNRSPRTAPNLRSFNTSSRTACSKRARSTSGSSWLPPARNRSRSGPMTRFSG